ncbi:MAG: DNA translocase FtsK 4TM domain-containing protein, partial [Acidobacteria bacterium]|nr:DNA translocase FtsK 4TM domain-containing protein [Acidobacteriota bacterium]
MNFLVPTKHPRANEAVGLVLFTLTALLLLSLLSYHPTDPSFNTSRNRLHAGTVENLVGEFGSTLADLLLQAFGYPAFMLPVVFAIFGWKWLRSRQIENPGFKAAGLLALFGSACALCGLLFPNFLDFGWTLKAGGLAGDLLADWL